MDAQNMQVINTLKDGTITPQTITGLANYSGLYDIGNDRILVSAAGSVGNKLKLAIGLNNHETVGVDLVASVANDIAAHGAVPLFFCDYIGTSKIYSDRVESIVKGIAEGCKQAGVVLIDGKTDEMPGFYKLDEYALNGFGVGVISRDDLIDGSKIEAGHILIGLASDGVHCSGYSMIRKLFSLDAVSLSYYVDSLGSNLKDELLKPTRIYNNIVQSLTKRFHLSGVANIASGGLVRSIPRMLPDGLQARIRLGSWPIQPVFEIIRAANKTPMDELFPVFNMGIGLVLAVPDHYAEAVVRCALEMDERAYIIGDVVKNADEGIVFVD